MKKEVPNMMSNSLNQLEGASSFLVWHREFRANAMKDKVWNILQGEESIGKEPVLEQCLAEAMNQIFTDVPCTSANQRPVTRRYDRGPISNIAENIKLNLPPTKSAVNDTQPLSDIATELAMFRFARDCTKWESDKSKLQVLHNLLSTSVKPNLLKDTNFETDPISCYKDLVQKFKGSQHRTAMALLREFCNINLPSFIHGGKIDAKGYTQHLVVLQLDLKEYEHNLSDNEVSEQLLYGLPPTFDSFCMSYETLMRVRGTPDTHDLTLLVERLVEECDERNRMNLRTYQSYRHCDQCNDCGRYH